MKRKSLVRCLFFPHVLKHILKATLAGIVSVLLAPMEMGAVGPSLVKWAQPPEAVDTHDIYLGWNEPSLVNSQWIAADDWVCTTTNPVTRIRWWGSFLDHQSPDPPRLPDAFNLSIWTDVPAGTNAGSFSRPGHVLQTIHCVDFSWQFVGWDFDPRTQMYEACFLFEQQLRPDEWFVQDPGRTGTNVFWLSIAAVYPVSPAATPWGWKTRPRDPSSEAPDTAVRIFAPTDPQPGMLYGGGEPIYWPGPGSSNAWDLAFELITEDYPVVEKWLQPPDLTPQGIDVDATVEPAPPYLLADDFLCTSPGPLTDITIWGSWRGDQLPGEPTEVEFSLSIHKDIPAADSPTGYSMPGELLWQRRFAPGTFRVTQLPVQVEEGWMVPPEEYTFPGDTMVFQYDFRLEPGQAFPQEGTDAQPVVYWLDVQARPSSAIPVITRFGWKTSGLHWNDDAVWIRHADPPPAGVDWNELRYPPGHPRMGESIDLAFRLATAGEALPERKWSQPPVLVTTGNFFNGWNEPSVYGPGPIVADDWVCTNAQPVTDLHWWGSFVGWQGRIEEVEPLVPDAFQVTIWTDVPAGVDRPYSHPGQVVGEFLCKDFTYQLVGWDIDPRNPGAPPEACFRFDQDLPQAEWFHQAPGTNIYWISIAARYDSGTVPNYLWGWKTRPRDPNSPAPDDAVRIFDPRAPVLGNAFLQGEPIEFPLGNSWDTAFMLTTRGVVPQEDFGDAPDPRYPTLLLHNGARHRATTSIFLGNLIDTEQDGQPDPNALGDDNNNLPDEDGVTFTSPLVPGHLATVDVVAFGVGRLNAWLDFAGDGSWAEAGDQILTNRALNAGLNSLSFAVPLNAVTGQTFARFRFSTTANLSYTGSAPDGEVEDHPVQIEEAMPQADLGDAPDRSNSLGAGMTAYPRGGPPGTPANYPTVYMAGSPPYGPIHLRPQAAAFLGGGVSLELEADLGPDQDPSNNLKPLTDGSDLDGRDDGVLFPLSLPHCVPTSFQYQVTVAGPPPVDAFYVNVWFDWNRDGDWDDTLLCQPGGQAAREWAVQNQVVTIPAGPPTPFVLTLTTPSFVSWHSVDLPRPVWMRITLSEQQWSPTGPQPLAGGEGPVGGYTFGETEDYYVEEYETEALDFGDAPEPSYPTLLPTGASHTIMPGMRMGALIDAESDGQPDPMALGDDNNNLPDEDGVVLTTPLVPGQMASVDVTVSVAGNLNAWVDFGGDGSWAEAGDHVIQQPVNPGPNTFTFPVPLHAVPGDTFARFRYSTVRNLPYDGPAPDGEVEDLRVPIEAAEPEVDLGDAPDSSNTVGPAMTAYPIGGPPGIVARFPTVFGAGSPPYGPMHLQPRAIAYLGPGVSLEVEADLGPDEDGLNNLQPGSDLPDQDGRDDGVLFPLRLPHCQITRFQYQVTAVALAAGPLYVNVWFDWNRDGDWDDTLACPNGGSAPEWAVQNQQVIWAGPGGITMTTPNFLAWHPSIEQRPLWMRITLAEQPWPSAPIANPVGGEGPANGYVYGETEDYYIGQYVVDETLDYGDAPDPTYPTLLASNGARHGLVPGFMLGNVQDAEIDGLPDPNALGDDHANLPDEDGVVFARPLLLSTLACVDVTLTAGPAGGRLEGWVDFNGNGIWDPAEQVFSSLPLVPGPNPGLCFAVPNTAVLGPSFARFRLSSRGGLAPSGPAQDGEVEDYPVTVWQAGPSTNIVITNIVVTNIVVSGSTSQVVTVEWTAEAGVHYQLQATDTLDNAPALVWTNVGLEVIGPAHSQTEINSPVKPQRFYRVMAPYVWP